MSKTEKNNGRASITIGNERDDDSPIERLSTLIGLSPPHAPLFPAERHYRHTRGKLETMQELLRQELM
jgi:hypothetical protein